MNETAPSPLTEASPASLDEYFSRKPPYDADTLAKIKQEFRRMREQVWSKGGEQTASGKPKAKKAGTKATEIGLDIFATDPEATP